MCRSFPSKQHFQGAKTTTHECRPSPCVNVCFYKSFSPLLLHLLSIHPSRVTFSLQVEGERLARLPCKKAPFRDNVCRVRVK
mmetsp:Transcript_1498/g.3714  ORF Transcript_1498/g.3714 Transcript_1498/m.3714 type:complete len:82 (-) Transcript_1498:1201-1446(-)